jgi:hypothetical protein
MPVSRKRRPKSSARKRLPCPDAVGVTDGDNRVIGWDWRAAHAFAREQGWTSGGCDDDCAERRCIEPINDGSFRHAIAPGVSSVADTAAVAAWLDAYPDPVVHVPGRGGFSPAPGWTVSDVMRAARGERLL